MGNQEVASSRGLPLEACIYGLRNVSVGDDEQTRIETELENIPDDALRAEVFELVSNGNYELAYLAAMKPTLTTVSRNDVVRGAYTYALEEVDGDDETPLEELIEAEVTEILNMFDQLIVGWSKGF